MSGIIMSLNLNYKNLMQIINIHWYLLNLTKIMHIIL